MSYCDSLLPSDVIDDIINTRLIRKNVLVPDRAYYLTSTPLKSLNDPEYRWYHKGEIADIMPYGSRRNQLGIKTINYVALCQKINEGIAAKKVKAHDFSFELFQYLIERHPNLHGKKIKKVNFQPIDRYHYYRRHKGECQICGSVYPYGSCNVYRYAEPSSQLSQLHHINPEEPLDDLNVVTLCVHCHQLVHLTLYTLGWWKYARPL